MQIFYCDLIDFQTFLGHDLPAQKKVPLLWFANNRFGIYHVKPVSTVITIAP